MKLRNFISCVSLIGDNSHLMFGPQPNSKRPLTRPTAFHKHLQSGMAVLRSLLLLLKRPSLGTENTRPLQTETLLHREEMGLVQATEPWSLKV